MAVAATHIRFALDLAKKLQVKDVNKYISGTIYPDSRYVTGIERKLTHDQKMFDGDILKLDDFKKGWHVHLICDRLQKEITKEKFGEIFVKAGKDQAQGSEFWVNLTSLKIVQDIFDAQEFEIKKYLPCLDYIENPNGENINKLKEYKNIFQDLYSGAMPPSVEQYVTMWKLMQIGDELAEQIKNQTTEYLANAAVVSKVKNIYSEMIKRV